MDKMGERIKIKNKIDVMYAESFSKEFAQNIIKDKEFVSEIVLIVVELAENLLKYGDGGEIVLKNDEEKIEICSIDSKKYVSPQEFMKNGFKSPLSLGLGLKIIKHHSDSFEISYEENFKIKVYKFLKKILPKCEVSVFSYSFLGETHFNGDGYLILHTHRDIFIVICDALGHGKGAYDMKEKVLEYIKENYKGGTSLTEFFQKIHYAMKGERGAAIGIGKIYKINSEIKLEYIGIGNITSFISYNGKHHHLLSRDGILGGGLPKIFKNEHGFKEAIFLLWTDGISYHPESNFESKEPIMIAQEIITNYRRKTDDATILVAKIES